MKPSLAGGALAVVLLIVLVVAHSTFFIQVGRRPHRRVDLPGQNSQAVYQRMQTERQREAAEFRAQGSQKSQEIRARADRDVTVLLA